MMSDQLQALVDRALENQPFECSYTREQWLKTFAGLIVQECANRASWAQDTGAEDIGGEVLKHFGVEE